MRFTQLQHAVKLFAQNSGEINDALNTAVNVLISIPCSRSLKILQQGILDCLQLADRTS